MSKTLCTICQQRKAKHYSPPRCRQCVSGRTKQMGRPKGIKQPAVMRKATIRGELTVLRARGRPRLDYDLPDAVIEARFAAAKRKVLAESPGVAPDAWSTRYALEDA
jgi:hypothetical protein